MKTNPYNPDRANEHMGKRWHVVAGDVLLAGYDSKEDAYTAAKIARHVYARFGDNVTLILVNDNHPSAVEPATPNQKRYVYSLAIDLGIQDDIDDQCRDRYGVPVDGLTKRQAGETIWRLRAELDALTLAGFGTKGNV